MALYSRFLLISIFHTFILPFFLVLLLSLFIPPNGEWTKATWVGIYIISVPILDTLLSIPKSHFQRIERKRLGAEVIPKVVGNLPGNIDILWDLVINERSEYVGDTIRKWSFTYGPTFNLNILWANQIITVDPENVKHVLTTSFDSFEKGEKLADMMSFCGSGIFTTDGSSWKHHRTTARPFFARERISDLHLFEKHSVKVIKILKDDATMPIDVQDIFSRFTFDAGAEFLFGGRVNSLDAFHSEQNSNSNAFIRAFNTVSRVASERIRIGSTWPLFELFGDKTIQPMKIINAFIDPIIQEAMRDIPSKDAMEDRTFLDHLIRTTGDVKEIRDELLNILLAARDTTASLITFTTYCLALHPNVMTQLREEIIGIIGDSNPPTLADIRQMTFLKAVIYEVLRLFPPVPFNIRRSITSSALPSPLSNIGGGGGGRPLYMPPRTSITYSPLLIQRDERLWPDSPSSFKPERWLIGETTTEHTKKPHVQTPFIFVPFSAGARICIGQQFAYNECSYIIIKLLQQFKSFELAPEAHPPDSLPPTQEWIKNARPSPARHVIEKCWPKSTLTLYSKGGLWIRSRIAE